MALLYAALIAIAQGHRAAALAERRLEPSGIDLLGFASDAVVALAMLGVVLLAGRLRLVAAALVAAAFGVLHQANLEHLNTLGGSLNWFYADQLTEATFLRGSVLDAGVHPAALVLTGLCTVLCVIAAKRISTPVNRLVWLSVAPASLIVAGVLMPISPAAMAWRQSNVVAENVNAWVGRLVSTGPVKAAAALDDLGVQKLRTALQPDAVGAKPRFDLPRRQANVLLVLVEGASAAYLASVRERFGLPRNFPLDMPRLDRRSRSGLLFPNFIANQRQTSRGEYAVLCGDLPALVTRPSRMTSGKPLPHRCLPQVMRDLGYATVYLQAAPLSYNHKDTFMPATGFEQSHGVAWFKDAPYRSFWGVDDGLFFEGALRMVDALQAEPRPWFLTLLTVGTHHPYWRPVGKTGQFESVQLGDALDYADLSLEEFLSNLQHRGVLDDTLVVVTSDEAAGLKDDRYGYTSTVGGNLGTLLVLSPERWTGVVNDAYMQADLPLSILDYLGHAQSWKEGVGRSVFREYEAPRPLAFGNTYRRIVGLVEEGREVTVCDEVFARCDAFTVPPDTVFRSDAAGARTARLDSVRLLRALAEYSVRDPEGRAAAGPTGLLPEQIALTSESGFDLAAGHQFLLGGQDWWQPAGQTAEVELELRYTGPSTANVRAQMVLGVEAIVAGTVFEGLREGDRARMRFDFTPPAALGPLQVMVSAMRADGERARLEVVEAEVRFPRDRRADEELKVHEFKVLRARQ